MGESVQEFEGEREGNDGMVMNTRYIIQSPFSISGCW